jgi:malate dehydrogenase (oxaloacetate-decarboxylating)(NADP+)
MLPLLWLLCKVQVYYLIFYFGEKMAITKESILKYHDGGKIGVGLTKNLTTVEELSMAYTPGVALPVKEIAGNSDLVYKLTAKRKLVAVVTDGTAILGLGDLGAAASIPVMEGKAALFKSFGDVDGWPVPLNCCRVDGKSEGPTDPQRIIDAVCAIAPMYGGVNLEDIAAPACFEIEDKLDAMLDIPVFHDDQWGTAVITLAGVMNYSKLCGLSLAELNVVVNGAGSAGIRIAEMLKTAGVESLVICDSKGIITTDRVGLTVQKQKHAVESSGGTVSDALKGAHVFVGVSVADCISAADIQSMADYPAIFAMANPDPEISPDTVRKAMAGKPYVMATGRSDYPNQINNVLGFPFLFRGALDVGATTINLQMKVAAAEALARTAQLPVPEDVKRIYKGETLEFGSDYIIPKPFDRRLFVEVSYAVAKAAVESGVAKDIDLVQYRAELEQHNIDR